jgi:hypothetical protein
MITQVNELSEAAFLSQTELIAEGDRIKETLMDIVIE